MGVRPVQLADMQGEAAVVHDRHKKFLHQFGVVGADFLGGNLEAVAEVRAPGAVECHLHQSLIQRCHEMAEAMDTAPIAKRLRQGLANGDPHILIGVVVVDVGIPHRIDLQVDQAMAADLMEHVIQEGHAGAGLALAGSVQIQPHLHVGFTGDSVDFS